ncbi:MAG TPA: LacI family DNA-binding transcriptional regulator [Anaerolineales bacterium]|nr:LacI family DNA-binding transcriptional regulator [Anaerolineales bacterium]
MKRVTIKEVAKTANVSTQTVSRVINERPDVSPTTRKSVQDVIQKLGYQPSALARSLIHQRSYTLGVVTAGLRHIGPSRTLNGITTAAEEAGYALLLKELPRYDTDNVEPIFQALISRHVDGIIWAVPEVGENRNWVENHYLGFDVPIVYLTMEPRENISMVSIDNYLGGRLAMSHLLEQGYQHIGHISGPLDWWEARQRKAAWEDALGAAGRECHNRFWVEGNWSSSSGSQAIEKLFEQYPEMDSVFVANDQMALSVLQVAYQRGKKIPEDLGIIGFDNIAESAYFCPPLTTIQHDQYEVAKVAVEEIIKIIEAGWQEVEPPEIKPIMLMPTLVVRQSSFKKGGEFGKEMKKNKNEEVPA